MKSQLFIPPFATPSYPLIPRTSPPGGRLDEIYLDTRLHPGDVEFLKHLVYANDNRSEHTVKPPYSNNSWKK
jgi:hypothetical protein